MQASCKLRCASKSDTQCLLLPRLTLLLKGTSPPRLLPPGFCLPPQGILEIGRTTFTIIILLLGAAVFIADTDRLVLKPLERMVQLVGEFL